MAVLRRRRTWSILPGATARNGVWARHRMRPRILPSQVSLAAGRRLPFWPAATSASGRRRRGQSFTSVIPGQVTHNSLIRQVDVVLLLGSNKAEQYEEELE